MQYLDPRNVQKVVASYFALLPRVKPPTTLDIDSQLTKVCLCAQELDSSTLLHLKQEFTVLYDLFVGMAGETKQAEHPAIANILALRQCEQQPLPISELRRVIPEAVESLRKALRNRDYLRLFACLGRLRGGIGEFFVRKY